MKDKPAAQAQAAQPAGVVEVADTVKAGTNGAEHAPRLGVVLLAFGAVLLVACAAPFLAGLQNIIGLVIIGIGVYQAWKLNRRVPLVITGPHVLSSAGAAAVGQ
jgi:hypothetical protein